MSLRAALNVPGFRTIMSPHVPARTPNAGLPQLVNRSWNSTYADRASCPRDAKIELNLCVGAGTFAKV